MSVTATQTQVIVNFKFDIGNNSDGTVKTAIQTLGAINKDNMDIQKAYNIAELLAPCLTKSIYSVEQIVTSTITDAD